MDKHKIIELKGITKEYEGEPVLRGIDLNIHDKEFVTLLGPSGCGKTTTLRIVGGFITPDSGDVLFDGKKVNDLPPYKRPVNTVFQKYALFPHLNVYENVAFGLRLKHTPEAEVSRRVGEMLEMVDLKGFDKRGVNQLSGGQQQRIAIARALAMKPELLLFDEPTSALDPELEVEVLNIIRRLVDEKQTIVIITHKMSFAREVADKVVFFDEGKILKEGTYTELEQSNIPRITQFLNMLN